MNHLKDMTIGELGAFICSYLNRNGLDCVLTGGASVSIYSKNLYQSADMDFIEQNYKSKKELTELMEKIGFTEKNRYYFHPEVHWFIEFPSGPLAFGNEPVKEIVELEYQTGTLRIISPTDCVKDRLAAYFFWDDLQSLEQAKMVSSNNNVDFNELRRWSEKQGYLDRFEKFQREMK